MKLYYYGYFLRNTNTQKKINYNIRPLLDAFVASSDMPLKKSFKRDKENLYLTKIQQNKNLFYFSRTDDENTLKTINEKSISVDDIAKLLSADLKVAYSSILYVEPTVSVIASSSGLGCPRIDVLIDFINSLFQFVGLDAFEIEVKALTHKTTQVDLMNLELVKSAYIDVAADKTVGALLSKTLFGNIDDEVSSFRIIVEPTKNNMSGAFKKLLKYSSKKSNNVISVGAKGKAEDELKGQIAEYWLDSQDALSSSLNVKAVVFTLIEQIEKKYDDLKPTILSLHKKFIKNEVNIINKKQVQLDKYHNPKMFKL